MPSLLTRTCLPVTVACFGDRNLFRNTKPTRMHEKPAMKMIIFSQISGLPILLRLWSLSMYEFDFRHRLCQVCQVWKMGRGWMRWNLRGSLSHQLNAKSYKLLSMFQEIQTFISHSYVNMVNMNKLGIHVLFWFTEYQDYLCIACKKKNCSFVG